MQAMIGKILRRYGTQMELQREGESLEFRAFLHHTGSKNWHNMEKAFSPLGQIPRGQYAVITPPQINLQIGDTLCWGGRRFAIRRIETILYRDEPLYRWGLCVERGSEEPWQRS